ncbi:deaminase [Ramlibacter sp.]|uniref:deaminase n=1 Tax=Ramlibacter sp. TaxID=1917967 RepID=UPI003D109DC7
MKRRPFLALSTVVAVPALRAQPSLPQHRWYEAAESMRRLALAQGDQPYGAVVVHSDRIVGQAPSRVIQRKDSDAHAEREAIRDARERFGPDALRGAVLYSTSRPCALCEATAAQAGVARMIHGPGLTDAGPPASSR